MSVPEIAILISAITALIVSLIAQILTHYFSIRREVQKYTNEIYQNFISSILVELFLFYDTRTAFRRGHDIQLDDEVKNYKKIVKSIEENRKYIGINTLFLNYQMITFMNFDESGFLTFVRQLSVFKSVIDDSYKIIKQFSKFDIRGGKKQIYISKKYVLLYDIWMNYTIFSGNFIFASMAMGLDFYFDENKVRNKIRRGIYYMYMKLLQYKRGHSNNATIQYSKVISLLFIKRTERDKYRNSIINLIEEDLSSEFYHDLYYNIYPGMPLDDLEKHENIDNIITPNNIQQEVVNEIPIIHSDPEKIYELDIDSDGDNEIITLTGTSISIAKFINESIKPIETDQPNVPFLNFGRPNMMDVDNDNINEIVFILNFSTDHALLICKYDNGKVIILKKIKPEGWDFMTSYFPSGSITSLNEDGTIGIISESYGEVPISLIPKDYQITDAFSKLGRLRHTWKWNDLLGGFELLKEELLHIGQGRY